MTLVRVLTASVVAMPAVASAQRLGGAASADVSLVRVFLALLVCLILAIVAILFVRQRLGGRLPSFMPRMAQGRARIRLVESRRAGLQSELALAECDGTEYLLLISPGGPLLLREGPAPAAEAE